MPGGGISSSEHSKAAESTSQPALCSPWEEQCSPLSMPATDPAYFAKTLGVATKTALLRTPQPLLAIGTSCFPATQLCWEKDPSKPVLPISAVQKDKMTPCIRTNAYLKDDFFGNAGSLTRGQCPCTGAGH